MNISKIKLSYKDISLEFDQENLQYSIVAGKTQWETKSDFSPYIVLLEKKDNLSTGAKQGNEMATIGKSKMNRQGLFSTLKTPRAKAMS